MKQNYVTMTKTIDDTKVNKFINPIDECQVKYPPDINPICGQMGMPCPEVSNNI